VRSFRNLADADLAIPAEGCVLVGRNGHGKTSFIEALLYGEVFRSFRGAADLELARFGSEGFFTATDRVAAGYDVRTRTKKVTVDGAAPGRLADAIGVVRGVVLSPGDVALVAGGPRERRRYLDVMLSLTVTGYVDALGHYRRALQHRCRATLAEQPAWERVLAETGGKVAAARRGWVDAWQGRYRDLCAGMGEPGAARLEYAPSVPGDLLAALERSRERDLARGRTGVGPHRDDLCLTLEGRDLRTYGSAGQHRTAALALRLAEAETLDAPTICLDDAFAELDAGRSAELGALVEGMAAQGKQVIAAVPREGDVPDVIASLPRWRIEHGTIHA
jgi:DNA replication and repair protein RecF